WEHDGFWDVALKSFGVRGASSATDKKNELFGAISAQVDFLHDRGSHIAVDDLANDCRSLLDADSQRLGDLVAHRLNCAILVEPHLSAEVVVGVQITEDDVGVRDRGLRSPQVE